MASCCLWVWDFRRIWQITNEAGLKNVESSVKPTDLFTPTLSVGDLAALGVQVENLQVLVPR